MKNNILSIDEIIEKTKPIFDDEEFSFVDKVYLFGSYARNEANENSDIDFMICLSSYDGVGLNFYGLYPKLQEATNKNVDVLTENEVESLKNKLIYREMICIYDRQN